jgi:hypothetical protein
MHSFRDDLYHLGCSMSRFFQISRLLLFDSLPLFRKLQNSSVQLQHEHSAAKSSQEVFPPERQSFFGAAVGFQMSKDSDGNGSSRLPITAQSGSISSAYATGVAWSVP